MATTSFTKEIFFKEPEAIKRFNEVFEDDNPKRPINKDLGSDKTLERGKKLLNQLSWCNSNKEAILTKAKSLYQMITQGKANEKLKARCCDFLLDEELYKEYNT